MTTYRVWSGSRADGVVASSQVSFPVEHKVWLLPPQVDYPLSLTDPIVLALVAGAFLPSSIQFSAAAAPLASPTALICRELPGSRWSSRHGSPGCDGRSHSRHRVVLQLEQHTCE